MPNTMHPTAKSFLLLVVVAAATSTSFTTHALAPRRPAGRAIGAGTSTACVPWERDALLEFKQGITSDPAGLLASWQPGGGQDCCRWRGVRCSNRTGHVLELDLRNVHADDETALVGQISPSLLSLQHLEYLDLSFNELQGSTGQVPEFLGSLSNLRYLSLSSIRFSGSVPPQLGNLSKLHYLDLSFIPFSGSVPPQLGNLSKLHYLDLSNRQASMYSTDLSWLTHLPFLRYLDMESVNLSPVADWPHVVNMIPSLRFLDLSDCSLTSANQSLPHLNLTNLEELTLFLNKFDQPVASCWFWNLTGLKQLSLSGTGLYGQLPDALGSMESLQYLSLSYNQNSMSMATTSLKNLCNLTILYLDECFSHGNVTELIERLPQCSWNKLQELHLQGNQLTGVLPNRMRHLTSLVLLINLMGNNITGPLPAFIGNFTNLRTLDLSVNQLTGHVPSEIGMLNNLAKLDLSHNDLDGLITEEHLDGLQSLEYIDLSKNQLKISVGSEWLPPFRLQEAHFQSCQMGPLFPAWLKWQVDIIRLDISSTGIIDRIPDWFCNSLSKVTYLDMSKNQVSGELPTNMEIMSLEALYSSSNQLTGQIPPLPRNLALLDISTNSLSGYLPSNFGAPKLDTLLLYSNYISGRIPASICELHSLYALDLANNLFEGELPPCFGMKSLVFLLLSNNSFSGKFPQFLQNCTGLTFLDLAWNRFTGRLPVWIGDLMELQFLGLSHNMFHGHIPTNITNLSNLYHFSLADNGISGVIPWHLSNLTSMTKLNPVDPYRIPAGFRIIVGSLSIVTKRRQFSYEGLRVLEMATIDLSLNYLTGEIPEEIISLDALLNVNLSWNQLNGQVPDKIGAMKSLESLDLSNNKLSGEIPSSISELTYLSILDLSYNNLTGRIPSGRQLDTLYTENPSMYNGNTGLCGPPLQRSCPGNNASKDGDQKRYEHHSEPMFFHLGLGIGFVVGLWVVFCALMFKKAWRIAYFRLFDKLYDKTYVFVVVTWRRKLSTTPQSN